METILALGLGGGLLLLLKKRADARKADAALLGKLSLPVPGVTIPPTDPTHGGISIAVAPVPAPPRLVTEVPTVTPPTAPADAPEAYARGFNAVWAALAVDPFHGTMPRAERRRVDLIRPELGSEDDPDWVAGARAGKAAVMALADSPDTNERRREGFRWAYEAVVATPALADLPVFLPTTHPAFNAGAVDGRQDAFARLHDGVVPPFAATWPALVGLIDYPYLGVAPPASAYHHANP